MGAATAGQPLVDPDLNLEQVWEDEVPQSALPSSDPSDPLSVSSTASSTAERNTAFLNGPPCPSCSSPTFEGASNCHSCGRQLSLLCSSCGERSSVSSALCIYCGTSWSEVAQKLPSCCGVKPVTNQKFFGVCSLSLFPKERKAVASSAVNSSPPLSSASSNPFKFSNFSSFSSSFLSKFPGSVLSKVQQHKFVPLKKFRPVTSRDMGDSSQEVVLGGSDVKIVTRVRAVELEISSERDFLFCLRSFLDIRGIIHPAFTADNILFWEAVSGWLSINISWKQIFYYVEDVRKIRQRGEPLAVVDQLVFSQVLGSLSTAAHSRPTVVHQSSVNRTAFSSGDGKDARKNLIRRCVAAHYCIAFNESTGCSKPVDHKAGKKDTVVHHRCGWCKSVSHGGSSCSLAPKNLQ